MQIHYDAIYLAPHLDDAALSCGGQIYNQTKQGANILIVTIMAGDAPHDVTSGHAVELHERWELEKEVVATRRDEDIEASIILGADFAHWHIPDCVYRTILDTKELYYSSWSEIIGSVHPQEQPLIQQLGQKFASLPPASRIFVPLTVGNHVDHQIVRQAAEICFKENLYYYEDYPYVQTEGAIESVIPKYSKSWQSIEYSLSTEDIQKKAEAITAYKSQLSTFFTDTQDLMRQLRDYANQVGGERIWHKHKMA